MAGFDNDTMYADNVDFSGSATPAPTVTLNGQLLIGSTAAPNIRVATLTAGANITITNGAGSIMIAATGGGAGTVSGLTPDAFIAPGTSPVLPNGGGNIIVTGAQVASGVVGTNVIRTDSLAANTMTIEIQRATSAAVSTPADNGVSHFDSGVFTVGAGGFVSLGGGNVPPAQKFNVDANTGPGTDPVVPTALGVVTITGAQVAAGAVGTNVIRTDSLAANTYTIEVQRTTTAAVSTVADNGVSHFDNTIFTADGNGFISLVGGSVPSSQKFAVDASTVPGTNPVVPTGAGLVTITGAQVATGTVGTNVIRTDSVAANAYRIEIQRSTAVAGTDITKNGVSHFSNREFTVDANAFVALAVKPAFLAYLATNDANQIGNGATYNLGSVTALTLVYNTGGAMATNGIFTAPITGTYWFNGQILISNMVTSTSYQLSIVHLTAGLVKIRGSVIRYDFPAGVAATCQSVTALFMMNAGEKVRMSVSAGLEAGNTITIDSGSLADTLYTFFQGNLYQ